MPGKETFGDGRPDDQGRIVHHEDAADRLSAGVAGRARIGDREILVGRGERPMREGACAWEGPF